ncbi:MAG: hypothetical protein N2235_05625 [Fischerella sp.]|nr:hypothetical protein [Fischerella sp.]
MLFDTFNRATLCCVFGFPAPGIHPIVSNLHDSHSRTSRIEAILVLNTKLNIIASDPRLAAIKSIPLSHEPSHPQASFLRLYNKISIAYMATLTRNDVETQNFASLQNQNYLNTSFVIHSKF